MKLLKKLVEYTSKDGSKKKIYNLYLVLQNGDLIAVKPVYTNSSKDYYRLVAVAEPYASDSELPF